MWYCCSSITLTWPPFSLPHTIWVFRDGLSYGMPQELGPKVSLPPSGAVFTDHICSLSINKSLLLQCSWGIRIHSTLQEDGVGTVRTIHRLWWQLTLFLETLSVFSNSLILQQQWDNSTFGGSWVLYRLTMLCWSWFFLSFSDFRGWLAHLGFPTVLQHARTHSCDGARYTWL